jgi:triosephosphate isomerase (TIM)
MRRPLIAGNWKMNKTIAEAVAFMEGLKPRVADARHCDLLVAPPFTAVQAVARASAGSNIRVAAQDVACEKEGAYTGDISAAMISEAGATHVIVGHSERRHYHNETDDVIHRKLQAALAGGLTPIACVGETLDEREAGRTREVLTRQFEGGFAGLTVQEFSRIILAYEPVWAIGTGRTATPELAAESHCILRGLVERSFGREAAERVLILYGGSVKPENIKGLMEQEDIDGALVGGASLDVESFSAIVQY